MHRLIHHFLLFTVIALSVHLASAQMSIDKGVQFEHNLSWTQIKAKANSEQKYIFVDCYATWCGPCKFMRAIIFPQQTMGDFFNDRFVSVEVQMDSTAKDSSEVRDWYQAAHHLKTQYAVQAYPTYLIFSPDGRLVHRIIGGRETSGAFITMVREAFDSTKQYYTQLRQFEAGRRDSAFLRRLTLMARYDNTVGPLVFKAWLATQSTALTPTALQFMQEFTRTTADPGFNLFLRRGQEVDKILGEGQAASLVTMVLYRQYVAPQLRSSGADGPDWKAIQNSIVVKFPAQAAEVTARGKVQYYQSKKDWAQFQPAIVAYMQKYGAHATPGELNQFAYTVFVNCPDMSCVTDALNWSKRSLQDKPVPEYMNTYANILYKMGKKDEAIAWEQKALDGAGSYNRDNFRRVLDKMRQGGKEK
jgi:thioredoxin-related protein